MRHKIKSQLLKNYEKAVRGAAPKPSTIPITDTILCSHTVLYKNDGKLEHMQRALLIDWMNLWCFVSVIEHMDQPWLNTMIWLYLCDMKRQAQPFKVSLETFDYNNDYSLPHQMEVLASTYIEPPTQEHDTDYNSYVMRNQP